MTLGIKQSPCLITNTIYSLLILILILFMVAILINHLYIFFKNHFFCANDLINYPIDKSI